MSMTVLLLNGPNLNLLGTREPHIYGRKTLADIEQECIKLAQEQGVTVYCEQSNGEGQLVDIIHLARGKADAIVINPGAYSHTSIALRDALTGSDLPVYEVHISNIHARESFRHVSYISGIARGVICGLGTKGYRYAILAAIEESKI